MIDSEISRYYRQIRKLLGCPNPFKIRLINELHTNINEDLLNNPQLTYAEIEKKYGTPETIANSYFDSLEEDTYALKAHRYEKIVKIIILCLLILSFIIFLYIFHINKIVQNTNVTNYTETIEEY